jgi:SAM-dependent methyltransferase
MSKFSSFDRRNYRTLSARDGYALWSSTYETTIKPDMDGWLLDHVDSVAWNDVRRAADLGCGTGRTGVWLRSRGVPSIDGVDLTSEMLDAARRRGIYDSLRVADACDTGLPTEAYDVVTSCLIDEHLRDLGPLYRESARLARPGGVHILVGFHPFFIMKTGMPTHFDGPTGEPIAVETHVHLLSAHVQAAMAAGWTLAQMHEQTIDERWIAAKPSWEAYRDVPVSFLFVWRRRGCAPWR